MRYSLATFLLFVTLVAVGCWWYVTMRPRWAADASLAELELLQEQQKTGQLEWGTEMRELIEIGPPALPELIKTLDATPEDDRYNLRTIPFAMNCIEDPRAVPALIRAIPRCFGLDGSDMGYRVGDAKLRKYLAERHGDQDRSFSLSYGRPVTEVFRALKKLTGQDFDHLDLAFVAKRPDDTPRQTYLKRELYEQSAQRWAAWWESNWRKYTSDWRYSKVHLPIRSSADLGSGVDLALDENTGRVAKGRLRGMIIQPVCARSERICFLDVDTNRWSVLPKRFAHLEEPVEALPADVLAWAKQEGFDFYGAKLQVDGESHYVIKAIETQMIEIDRQSNNRSWTVASVKQQGRPTGELVAHWDADQEEPVIESPGDFVFITKENTVGILSLGAEVTSTGYRFGEASKEQNLATTGHRLGRRMGLSYLVPGN